MSGHLSTRAFGAAVLVLLAAASGARGAEESPTVAIVLQSVERADKRLQKIARNLSSLVEVFLSAEEGIRLVDRTTLDKALEELALVSGEEAERLGRLTRAGTLLVGAVERDGGRYLLDAHLVEGLSGKIVRYLKQRFAGKDIPRVATELARLVRRAALGLGPPRVTVAVANFDYEGVSDLLAPLQLRLKALLVRSLLRYPEIRVLERESMSALVDELEFTLRGSADASDLPSELPHRRAAYFVAGSYDDLTGKKEPWVRLRVSLVAAEGPVITVREDAALKDVARLSGALASRIAREVLGRDAPGVGTADPGVAHRRGYVGHFNAALSLCWDLFGLYPSAVPGLERPAGRGKKIHESAPIYPVLLERIANELECALYLEPGDLPAKLLLAVVYSNHFAWNRERAWKLLADVEAADPEGEFGRGARRVRIETCQRAICDEPKRDRARWRAKLVDAYVSVFRDTPDDLRESWEMDALARAGFQAWYSLKDYSRAFDINREFLEYVAEKRALQAPHDIGARLPWAMENFFKSARELGRSEEAREIASGLAARLVRSGSAERHAPPESSLGGPKPHPAEVTNVAAPSEHGASAGADGRLVVLLYMGLGKGAREDGALDEALSAFSGAVALCRGEKHPWFTTRDKMSKRHIGELLCLAGKEGEGEPLLLAMLEGHIRGSAAGDEVIEIAAFLGDRYEKRGEWRKAARLYQIAYTVPYYRTDRRLIERIARARKRLGRAAPRGPRRIDATQFRPDGLRRIRKIVPDGRKLWCVASLNAGEGGRLLCFDTREESWEELARGARATCVLPSPEGLYVGTAGNGLWFRPAGGGEWRKTTEENGLPFNYVSELAPLDGKIYVGFCRYEQGGLGVLQENGAVRLLESAGGKIANAGQVAAFNGNLWISEYVKGVWRFDPRTSAAECLFRRPGWASADEDGVWILPARGLDVHRVERDGRTRSLFPERFPPREKCPPMFSLRCAVRAGGKVWLGGSAMGLLESCGIYSYDPDTKELVIYGPQDGIEAKRTFCVAKTPGFLWFGTTNGLVRIRVPEERAGRKRERR